jgi:hypothetical protein
MVKVHHVKKRSPSEIRIETIDQLQLKVQEIFELPLDPTIYRFKC